MADVSLFIQRGWQNVWKQKTIWLFSALPIINQLVLRIYNRDEQNPALLCLYLVVVIITFVLSVVSFIGVPYLAFNFSIGKPKTVRETLDAVTIFSWRIIGCSALGFLVLVPCFLLVLAIALRDPTHPLPVSNIAILVFFPLSIFNCLWSFSIFGFFENDWGIRKSIENAWALFTSHFGTLALFGILMVVILRICSTVSGMLTVLLQSGFDAAALSKLNYIDPSTTLGKNMLFILINGVNQTVYNTFSVSVIVLAYLKYSAAKIPPMEKSG